MLHRAAEGGGGGIEAEIADLLDWAEENDIIKRDVHTTLMKEFSDKVNIQGCGYVNVNKLLLLMILMLLLRI